MVNKAILIGRIGNDPEIKTFESGSKVIKLSLATSEWKKQDTGWEETTTWHYVDYYTKHDKTLLKGDLVYVEGAISYRKYTDADGSEKKVTTIKAHKLIIVKAGKQHPGAEDDDNETVQSDDLPF